MVTGLPDMHVEHDGVCKGCPLGNNAKGSFPRTDNRYNKIMEIINLYVCKKITLPYLGKFLYYVIFINDFSCKT
jgi:hypothetical protein